MKVTVFVIVFLAVALVFVFVPELDIAFSRLFYREGEDFFLRGWRPIVYFYRHMPMISTATVVLVAVLSILRMIPALARLHVRRRVIAYILLSLAIGPVLVTNLILKDNFGRARPKYTQEFGGPRTFTPAFVVSDECPKNCAFVSGHAATGFFVVTFAFLLAPGRLRSAAIAGAVTLGTAAGLARVVVGSHYLSDIVFAGFINVGIAWALYVWVVKRNGFAGPPFDRWRGWAQSLWRRVQRASPGARRVLHGSVAALVAFLAAHSYVFFDRPAYLWFRSLGEDFYLVAHNIADFGRSEFWLVPAFAGFAVLWAASRWTKAGEERERLRAWSNVPLFVFAAVSVSGVVVQLLKIAFGRIRPKIFYGTGEYGFEWFQLDGALQSFPSGHAVTIATVMTALYFMFPRFLPAYLSVGAVIILARAAEGDHFLSDILVGSYLGIVITAWLRTVFERSGVDLAAAAKGRMEHAPKAPWPHRLGIPAPVVNAVTAALGRRRDDPAGLR